MEIRISTPITERDVHDTILWAKRLASQAPGATLEVLPGADF